MVGRTPEFLGKKVEAKEMKIAMIIALLHPFLILVGTAMAERQYLLFNNTRYKPTSKVTDKEYHFPIKIKLTSTHLELLEDTELIEKW